MDSLPFICFIHIERCGGTTLHHLIQRNFPHYVALRSWYYWSNDHGNHFSSDDLQSLHRIMPWIGGIGGHTVRSFADYERILRPDVFRLAFFRNPIDRYLSHLNYQRNVMGIDWEVQEFLDEPRFNDYQTVRLARRPDVDEAMLEVEKNLDFVGLTERYDESLVLLKQRLDPCMRTARYERRNATTGVISWETLSEDQRRQVVANNELDARLYERIVQGPYRRQREGYNGDLENDLKLFQESLVDYSVPPITSIALKVYRNLIRYFIQPLAAGKLRTQRRPPDAEEGARFHSGDH